MQCRFINSMIQCPGSSLFSRGEVQKVAQKRSVEISDYCNRLMTLQSKISEFPKLLEFFELRSDDLNVPSNSKYVKALLFPSLFTMLWVD